MGLNVSGLVSIVVFYLLILAVGIWAGWKQKKRSESATENAMLAGRNIGTLVGMFTMTATCVGGGFINGSAEAVFTSGLIWCQTPLGYTTSLFVAGYFFARPMRRKGYTTMLDPFQEKYGNRIGAILFLPALFGELLWSATILAALGSTLAVILDLDTNLSIVISAAIAVFYTLFGGLYAVAYTDVIQLFCMAIGLILCVPFAWNHPAVDSEALAKDAWWGTIQTSDVGLYIDSYLMLIFGGIPWQGYFQRVLSSKTENQAVTVSYVAAIGCFLLAIPPICIGIVARGADWANGTDYGTNITSEYARMTLPLVLHYLTPTWVSFIGLGAVSAAVMSSADSSVLSVSTMFVRNVYKTVFVPRASEKHLLRVMWVTMVLSASLSSLLAMKTISIYLLFFFCSDFVYVLLFPQLFLIVYWNEGCNAYGCLISLFVGLFFRLLGGEPELGLPAAVAYPFYDSQNQKQLFPFKTLSMLLSMISHVLFSTLLRYLFTRGYLANRFDFLGSFQSTPRAVDAHHLDYLSKTQTEALLQDTKSTPINM